MAPKGQKKASLCYNNINCIHKLGHQDEKYIIYKYFTLDLLDHGLFYGFPLSYPSILEALISHKLQPKLLVISKSQLLQIGSDCEISWQRPKQAVILAKPPPLIVVSHLCQQGTAVALLAGSRTLSLVDKPCCHMASYHILVWYCCTSHGVIYKELVSYICISWRKWSAQRIEFDNETQNISAVFIVLG